MKFIKLSLCVLLAGFSSEIFGSEEVSLIFSESSCLLLSLDHSKDYDLTISQGKYNFLKNKSFVEYEKLLDNARQNENINSQIEGMQDAGLYLSYSLFLVNKLSQQDVCMLYKSYLVEDQIIKCFCFCCYPGSGPISRYLEQVEQSAARASRSLQNSILMENLA